MLTPIVELIANLSSALRRPEGGKIRLVREGGETQRDSPSSGLFSLVSSKRRMRGRGKWGAYTSV